MAADSVTAPTIELRPRQDRDLPFLRELYGSTRWQELAVSGWSDDQKRAFLDGQFRLQDEHYVKHYGDGEFQIIVRAAAAIGRLYLHRGPEEWRVVDISLLPQWCGRGIGGALMRDILAQAGDHGVPISLHVYIANPARRLYDRLGFVVEGPPSGLYQKLVFRHPD